MNKNRWQLVEALFHDLVPLSEPERIEKLASLELEDPEICVDVRSLLEVADEEKSLALVSDELDQMGVRENSLLVGKQLGPYRILHPLGSGGTSTVFLAVRDDGTYHRQVAIKLLNSGFRSPEFLKLFYREQQILAGLNHPNIAQLLDAGHTEEGIPYLVTEHIEGVSLDVYCRKHRLKVQECLKVFRKVCEAVIYAHQNLVIHRDLKPKNILVTPQGEPMLLDFGFAKMLNANFNAKGAASQVWMRMLTPAYASPEQFYGHPMTTSSDVFSLGVILYEILTGKRPFHAEEGDMRAMAKMLCEEEPLKPSHAAQPAVLKDLHSQQDAVLPGFERRSRLLKGDLDAIILKALRKEPQSRYASVANLVEDIKRYQEKQPVRARQDSFFYRAGKYMGRNWGMLTVASLLLVVLLTFSHSQSKQAKSLAVALEKARIAQHTTDETISFLADLFKISDPRIAKGDDLSAREFLDRAASRIHEEFEGEPASKFKLVVLLGQVYLNLGLYPNALALLKQGESIVQNHQLSELELAYFDYLLGRATFEKGESQEALVYLLRAYNRKASVLGEQHPGLAENLFQLGRVNNSVGDYTKSKVYFEKSESLVMASGQQNQVLGFEIGIGKSVIDSNFGEYDLAIGRLIDLRDRAREQFGAEHTINFNIGSELGKVYRRKGDLKKAEESYRWVLKHSTAYYGNAHPQVASDKVNLGALLQSRGELVQAEGLYLEALGVMEKYIETKHDDILTTRVNLGAVYYGQKKYQKAVETIASALRIQEKYQGVGHPNTCRTRANLAMCYSKIKELVEAESLLRLNLALLKEQSLMNHHIYSVTVQNLGGILASNGSFSTAIPYLREADRVMREKGNKSVGFANNLCKLGFALGQVGLPDEAEPLFEDAHTIFKKNLKSGHPKIPAVRLYLGYNAYLMGNQKKGLKLIEESLAPSKAYLGPENLLIKKTEKLLRSSGSRLARISPQRK